MDAGTVWSLLVAVNLVVYVIFVRVRSEGGLVWTLLLGLLLGPLCWFVWLAMRTGRRRAEREELKDGLAGELGVRRTATDAALPLDAEAGSAPAA